MKNFLPLVFLTVLGIISSHTLNAQFTCEELKTNIVAEYGILCANTEFLASITFSPNCPGASSSGIPRVFNVRIPVRLINVAQNNGTTKFSNSEITNHFNVARTEFLKHNIELFQVGNIMLIKNSNIYDFQNNLEDGTVCSSNSVETLINSINFNPSIDYSLPVNQPLNIVFVNKFSLGKEGCGFQTTNLANGAADFPSHGNLVIISHPSSVNSNQNRDKVLIHELGHTFGLFHPQEDKYGSGNDCNLGDFINGTPFTDNANTVGTVCYLSSSCNYFSNICLLDGLNDSQAQTLLNNYMSYTGDCRKEFIEEQKQKMWEVVTLGFLKDICVTPDKPKVKIENGNELGNNISFVKGELPKLKSELTELGTNSIGIVEWYLVNGSQMTLLHNGDEGIDLKKIIFTSGNSIFKVRDVSLPNRNCVSEFNTFNVNTIIGGEIGVITPNGIQITDNEIAPFTYDFGNRTGAISNKFTISNTSNSPLTLATPPIVITGTNANNFSIQDTPPEIIPPNSSFSFTISFNPNSNIRGKANARNNIRIAKVSIISSDADESVFDFFVQGNLQTHIAIPTLNQWGLIILGLLILNLGLLLIYKEKGVII